MGKGKLQRVEALDWRWEGSVIAEGDDFEFGVRLRRRSQFAVDTRHFGRFTTNIYETCSRRSRILQGVQIEASPVVQCELKADKAFSI